MQEIIPMKKLNLLSSTVALTWKKSNQLTGFYMRATLALNRLINIPDHSSDDAKILQNLLFWMLCAWMTIPAKIDSINMQECLMFITYKSQLDLSFLSWDIRL